MDDAARLEALLAYVADEDRVCPRPMEWNEFHKSLPDTDADWHGTAPYVLSGWWSATDEQKAERLKVQIKWAADRGAIEAADRFLRALPIEVWHHSNPTKPNY